MSEIDDIIDVLNEVLEDGSVPKNVRTNIEQIIVALKGNEELSLRINKALNLLDEISDDSNIQAYTRTQIWNVASMLESFS